MRRGGTEVTAERLQNTIGLRCEGTTPERGRDAGEGEMETWRQKGKKPGLAMATAGPGILSPFCFVFNEHICTFSSWWTWLKG